MTSRRTPDRSDSLELLLDTICNTFGAVIFISLLVALMAQQSSQTPSEGNDANNALRQLSEVSARVRETQVVIDRLGLLTRQQGNILDRLSSSDTRALADELQDLTDARLTAVTDAKTALQSSTELESEIVLIQRQLHDQRQQLEAAGKENFRLSAELSRLKSLASRTATLPRVRETTRLSAVYALDDQKLYRVTEPDRSFNHSECDAGVRSGVMTITLRSGAGAPVSQSTLDSGALAQRFHGYDSGKRFIQLFVSRDSFAEFLFVKDTIVKLGFEYETIVMDGDTVELFVGESARENLVQ